MEGARAYSRGKRGESGADRHLSASSRDLLDKERPQIVSLARWPSSDIH